nr:unnamed protein product [Callosobruchus chinensis]
MTVCEFFGCTFLAFGPPFAMFVFTIASDPVRIIILIAAAFFWLLSLLLSSMLWFAVVPLRKELAFGLVFSVFCQEAFRYIIYKILRKAENGFKKISDDSATLIENKHILAYVSGLGFGIMSGAFSLVNVVADAIGPGTMGLKSGNEMFFISSAAISLCFILLHTFWSVIFFNAWDNKNLVQVGYVVLSHLFASCLTLLNRYQNYYTYRIAAFLQAEVPGGGWRGAPAAGPGTLPSAPEGGCKGGGSSRAWSSGILAKGPWAALCLPPAGERVSGQPEPPKSWRSSSAPDAGGATTVTLKRRIDTDCPAGNFENY